MASAKPYLSKLSLVLMVLNLYGRPSVSEWSSPTVFEILPEYGLPSGLLPDCVKSYTLSPEDGRFSVELEHSCYIQFDYLVYYDTRITGTLKMGSISNLKGIQVKRFFLWLDVDEIKVDLPPSDSIYFHLGLISKKLGVAQFQTIHSCRASSNLFFQLPPPPINGEIPMLLTE